MNTELSSMLPENMAECIAYIKRNADQYMKYCELRGKPVTYQEALEGTVNLISEITHEVLAEHVVLPENYG